MSCRLIHVIVDGAVSFLKDELYSIGCVWLFPHSSIDEHLSNLAIVSNAAGNMAVQLSLQLLGISSLGILLGMGIQR